MSEEARKPKSLALIRARAVATNLAIPMVVLDPDGTIVFFNVAAEVIFGRPFEESGELTTAEWAAAFSPEDASGTRIPMRELPAGVALTRKRPNHRVLLYRAADGRRHEIEVTAFPLMGREAELFGAVTIVWQRSSERSQGESGRGDEGEGVKSAHATVDEPIRSPESLVLILARELASNLATPIYIADAQENLFYFNESADQVAGRTFSETGRIPIADWVDMLAPATVDGVPLSRSEMPGGIASQQRMPTHASLRVTDFDGRAREIATTAFPLLAPDGDYHGIMVIFWEHV